MACVAFSAEPDAVAAAVALNETRPGFAAMLALNCAVAAGVNLTNFLVTQATSALTLQVLGKAKSVIAVAVSLWLFRNPVSALGMAGYAICLAGVVAYTHAKNVASARARSHKSTAAAASTHVAPAAAPVAAAPGDGADDVEQGRKWEHVT
jgi:hypothetical protein